MPRRVTTFVVTLAALLVYVATPAYANGPGSVALQVSGLNGAGTSVVPGTSCNSGGTGDSWAYNYSGVASAGQFTQTLPATVGFALDLHAEPATTSPSRTYQGGFLGPNSFTTLTNPRGSVQLAMSRGSCGNQLLAFDGSRASGVGTWVVAGGTGAYRQAAGTGTFSFFADVRPATNNAFQLQITGSIDVLDPALAIPNAKAEWAKPGDFENRKLTITYTVKNTGVGDAFAVQLTNVAPVTGGVTTNFSGPKLVGDIAAGKSRNVKVIYFLSKSNPPCAQIWTGCSVTADLTFHLTDALDSPTSPDPVIRATASPVP
jgi:hypothetical protein